ncbi:MAG: ribonuclease Z [Firmicutes bacterium ADurb.Bin182]|nr:MAG: ribonuclease Z [Firmicutes bacterium ADurb.Bin182]
MERLIVLGTGNAMVRKCYNTCFAIEKDGAYLLVDAGGGNGILAQLSKAGIPSTDIRELIVTHAHCDHMLGVIWVLREIGNLMAAGRYKGEFHIWCHLRLIEMLKTISGMTLLPKITSRFDKSIIFHAVENGTQANICGWPVTFFNIFSTKDEQYGFTMQLRCGKKLTCLGDEPFNPACLPYVRESDWFLSEAFCLYAQREQFKPYEKHHSTVKEACEKAAELNVPNLVLWHTEEENYEDKPNLYAAEGRLYYHGNLIVPKDLDVIPLSD